MRICRYVGVVSCLCLATPALAQQAPARPTPPPSTKASGPDIVVEGTVDTPSAWRRAESAHVIITSKSSAAELKRVSNNLERLYALMARLYHRTDTADDTVKLQVTLVDSADFFRAMKLRNLRSEEGPYAAGFGNQRYYDPREDGPVLVVARTDQTIDLDTALAQDRAFADAAGSADEDSSSSATASRPPIARKWEAVLYSAFAQHFMLTYLPAAYPRWYLDGVGALFSTLEVRRDGKVDYAREPENYRQIFRSYGNLRVREIVTGQYLDTAAGKSQWTPYHAWLLTHFFSFAKIKPVRMQQFQAYMMAIQRGTPMADAAKVFGDLRRLQDEVDIYLERGTEYARTETPPEVVGEPLINTLTRSSAATIEARIELGTRLAAPPVGVAGAGTDETATRAAWLAKLQGMVAHLPYNAEATLTEAEAECRSADDDACLADADQVLAKAPDNVRALTWRGIALTHQAIAGPAAARAAALIAARRPIVKAIRLDGDAPLPMVAYFQSFTLAEQPAPDQAMLAIVKVTRIVPAAPGPRLALAEELVRQGHADLARSVLAPVLYGGYDSPEKPIAMRLLAPPADIPQAIH